MKFMIEQSPSPIDAINGLASCSTVMRDVVHQHWNLVYNTYVLSTLSEDQVAVLEERGLTVKQRVDLVCGSQCAGCGVEHNTRICWPFPLRMCKGCIPFVLCSMSRLRSAYGVQDWALAGIRAKMFYKQQHFFLMRDVLEHLGVEHIMFAANIIVQRNREAVAAGLCSSIDELGKASPTFNCANFSRCPSTPAFIKGIEVMREELLRWRWHNLIDEWAGTPGIAPSIVRASSTLRDAISTKVPDASSVCWDTVRQDINTAKLMFEVAAVRSEFEQNFLRICHGAYPSLRDIIAAKLDQWFGLVRDAETLRIRASKALRVRDMVKLKFRCVRWMIRDVYMSVNHYRSLMERYLNNMIRLGSDDEDREEETFSPSQNEMLESLISSIRSLQTSVFDDCNMRDFRAMLQLVQDDEYQFRKMLIATLAQRYAYDLAGRDIPIPPHMWSAYSLADLHSRYAHALHGG